MKYNEMILYLLCVPGTDAAVDGDGDAISNHCHSSIQASLDKCYNDMSRMAKKGFNARALDSGRCSPVSYSHLTAAHASVRFT